MHLHILLGKVFHVEVGAVVVAALSVRSSGQQGRLVRVEVEAGSLGEPRAAQVRDLELKLLGLDFFAALVFVQPLATEVFVVEGLFNGTVLLHEAQAWVVGNVVLHALAHLVLLAAKVRALAWLGIDAPVNKIGGTVLHGGSHVRAHARRALKRVRLCPLAVAQRAALCCVSNVEAHLILQRDLCGHAQVTGQALAVDI